MAEDALLVAGHRQAIQRLEEDDPALPGRQVTERRQAAEDARVLQRLDDVAGLHTIKSWMPSTGFERLSRPSVPSIRPAMAISDSSRCSQATRSLPRLS